MRIYCSLIRTHRTCRPKLKDFDSKFSSCPLNPDSLFTPARRSYKDLVSIDASDCSCLSVDECKQFLHWNPFIDPTCSRSFQSGIQGLLTYQLYDGMCLPTTATVRDSLESLKYCCIETWFIVRLVVVNQPFIMVIRGNWFSLSVLFEFRQWIERTVRRTLTFSFIDNLPCKQCFMIFQCCCHGYKHIINIRSQFWFIPK